MTSKAVSRLTIEVGRLVSAAWFWKKPVKETPPLMKAALAAGAASAAAATATAETMCLKFI